jgi:hypothetical protein
LGRYLIGRRLSAVRRHFGGFYRGCGITLLFNALSFLSNHLGDIPFLTFLVIPSPRLERPHDEDCLALLEVVADELCGVSPRYDVDEVGLRLLVLHLPSSYGNAEGCNRNTVLSGLKFRIGTKIADQNNFVK